MARKNHLLLSGGRFACGSRQIHTFGDKFDGFRATAPEFRCAACAGSKQFARLVEMADEKARAAQPDILGGADLAAWEPEEDPNAWIARDRAIIKAHRAAA